MSDTIYIMFIEIILTVIAFFLLCIIGSLYDIRRKLELISNNTSTVGMLIALIDIKLKELLRANSDVDVDFDNEEVMEEAESKAKQKVTSLRDFLKEKGMDVDTK